MLTISQAELAGKAGVSLATLNNIERGSDARMSTLQKIKAALEADGIRFTNEQQKSYGVSLELTEEGEAHE